MNTFCSEMALFTVTRYLGEDEEKSVGKDISADDILKKIKSEAKARKKSREKYCNDLPETTVRNATDKDTTVDKLSKNKVEIQDKPEKKEKSEKKKRLIDLDAVEDHRESDEPQEKDSNNFTKVKVKKKKRKAGEQISDEEDVEVSSKKKKRKREKIHYETLDNEESGPIATSEISPVEPIEGQEKNESRNDKKKRKKLHIDGPTDLGGFTVLGSHKPVQLPKVTRVLPDWLSHPTEISRDLTENQLPVSDMPGLCENLVDKLQKNGITHFFPVQQQVIPALLSSSRCGFHIGPAGYRPSDICVSAPTGSGKTLAFVLPIVQALRNRVTCEIRALAVLPVQDLAKQVYQVFQTHCQDTCLKVGLLTGQKPFPDEQNLLVKRRLRGYVSQYDIIVATPGRLVDHINQTEGFDLNHLRYLVIDEADRMMEEIKQDWLVQVETAAHRSRPHIGPITASGCRNMYLPMQKLLYSATLSQNPEKLQQLNLFQPKLFTSVVKSSLKADISHIERENLNQKKNNDEVDTTMEVDQLEQKGDDEVEDYVGKYTTPATLSEFTVKTTSAEKPLMILHMLHHLNYKNILCFTNSVESTHRLYLLLKAYGGVEVREFSSGLKVARRNEILQQFMSGKIDIIICSDAMARGMDISNVNYVVLYDPPSFIQNYIHRIGRTARAGKQGSAITLLQEKEFFHFKKMIREAGKKTIKEMKITKAELKPLIPKFETALKEISTTLEEEKKRKSLTRHNKSQLQRTQKDQEAT